MTPRTHSRTDWDPPSQDTGWQAALDSSIGWLFVGGPLCSPRDSSHCNWLTKPPVDGGDGALEAVMTLGRRLQQGPLQSGVYHL